MHSSVSHGNRPCVRHGISNCQLADRVWDPTPSTCHVEFRDRYSPSFFIHFRPFSVILLCYSIILSHSVIPSHSIFRPFFHLYPFIPSHPFIFPYWDPTVPSSDLNLYSGSILVSATTPIISTPSYSGLLLYSYFYCSMIRSILIVPFRIYSDKL